MSRVRRKNIIFSVGMLVFVCILSVNPVTLMAADIPNNALPGGIDRNEGLELPEPPGEIFMVPPLQDRPLGVDEGERLFVRSISLRSAVDRPEARISLKEVRGLVENLRFASQELNDELASGFTKKELMHGAKLLRQLVDDPDQLDVSKEFLLESLVSEMRFKMRERWLTIGNLQQIADEVTRYYRSKGFILAQAYLPAQTVSDGNVVIQVIEGMVGKVIVQNNQRYSEALILEPFLQSVGRPAYKLDVESALLQLSDYPGLAVYGVFQPGSEVGTSDLILNVRQEKRHQTDVRFDNYGSEFTGEYRLHLSYTNNNLSRSADALNIRLMQSVSPNNSLYGAIKYQRPVFDRHNLFLFEASHNAYELDLDTIAIDGNSDALSLSWRRSFTRSRVKNKYSLLSLKRKSVELGASFPQSDELAIASLELGFDAFDFTYSGVNLGWIKVSQGFSAFGAMASENVQSSSRSGDSGAFAGSKFTKIEVRYDRLQTLSSEQSVLLSLYVHYSDDLLTSSEQMTIGGANSVRAYPSSEFLVDTGYFASLEWIIKAPGIAQVPVAGTTWGQVLQYVVFFDAAFGRRNDPLQSDVSAEFDTVSVRGIGFGMRFNYKGFTANLDMAAPLGDKEASNGKSTQALLKFNYIF